MTTVVVTLRPIGRGAWGPITLSYDPRVRSEQPTPMEFRRGQVVPIGAHSYRVSKVVTA
jgi:hypothetical protein